MEEGKTVYNINTGRGQGAGAGERSFRTRRGRGGMPIGGERFLLKRCHLLAILEFFWLEISPAVTRVSDKATES